MHSFLRIFRNDTWVLPFFRQYRGVLVLSLLLGVLTVGFGALLMFTSGYLICSAAEMPELGLYSLLVPLGLVQVFGVLKPFFGYFERLKSHDWVLRMTSQLRLRLYRSISGQGMFWRLAHRTGDALGLLASDIGHIQDLYLRTVFPFTIAWIVWLLTVVLFGVFSPLFGLAMLLILAVWTILLPLLSVLVNGARQARVKDLQTRLYAQALDDVAGLADWTFAQRRDDYIRRMMDADADMDRELARMARFDHARDFVSQLLFGLTATVILIWAAAHFATVDPAMAGIANRSVEWVAAFILGFFPLSEAMAALPDAAVQMTVHLDAVERMNELPEPADLPDQEPAPSVSALCEETAPSSSPDGEPSPGAPFSAAAPPVLELRDVRFSYGDRELLQGVDLNVAPGQKLAVLGPSGAGKSTLISLIRGDRTPTSGQVLVGGIPTCELGAAAPNVFGFIQQDTYLFNMTLFENVTIAKPQATREEVTQALEAVGLGALLRRLPDGLDTMVDEAGLRFSGGERHRVALARVLLQDAPIVILDEPCVSLDPPTEEALLETVSQVLQDKTIIMVTHHLAGVNRFDQVVFLEHGRIELSGTPAQLAASSARYQQLLALDSF